ncbi:uncharacterized protein [Triticum aestivum]|uniref:uncharacterized protein n=1 Tax=Triticum aestivum TaxID=4565 RepID=UPI001D01E8A7|nr:uncharacterized protein LOC123068899 [Triticum aestivum]XP_044347519.1 uncharacterized protein LOC123068899 [Triticum aestivum]XP_044347520.1 uncharacterized protein LOC123068899 [Triticum aestivum]XP_044347521.1 uncharacterized protein LOC123068899 [Triticum aestivum]XP_044347522.1 uncharacterized protein LOC123068899 [Triticum aestivum]XP_044347523.1 uncharacterized protein LOC123068899 [Triticum aestivum]XP_044347524.1 uncharacterized protein LOC123068899 [Triticum aestivum]XP_04438730
MSGWLLDSDTLYGLARSLPRSSRRYNAENSVEHGAPINTDNPEPGNHWLLKFGSLLKSKLIQGPQPKHHSSFICSTKTRLEIDLKSEGTSLLKEEQGLARGC